MLYFLLINFIFEITSISLFIVNTIKIKTIKYKVPLNRAPLFKELEKTQASILNPHLKRSF